MGTAHCIMNDNNSFNSIPYLTNEAFHLDPQSNSPTKFSTRWSYNQPALGYYYDGLFSTSIVARASDG